MADQKGSIVDNYAIGTPVSSIQCQSLSHDYFISELHRFRKIMCSKSFTLTQKEAAFEGLAFVYMNTSPLMKKENTRTVINDFQAIMTEWDIRKVYEPFRVKNRIKAIGLWKEFSNIPINNDDEIETEFQGFEVGTYRFDIWHWFEDEFDVSINDDLMGTDESPAHL